MINFDEFSLHSTLGPLHNYSCNYNYVFITQCASNAYYEAIQMHHETAAAYQEMTIN